MSKSLTFGDPPGGYPRQPLGPVLATPPTWGSGFGDPWGAPWPVGRFYTKCQTPENANEDRQKCVKSTYNMCQGTYFWPKVSKSRTLDPLGPPKQLFWSKNSPQGIKNSCFGGLRALKTVFLIDFGPPRASKTAVLEGAGI